MTPKQHWHSPNHPPPPLQETTDELMRFVKELRRANSALVDAFEKSKKRQQAEKKRIKQELVSYMNRVQSSSGPTNEVSGACVTAALDWEIDLFSLCLVPTNGED